MGAESVLEFGDKFYAGTLTPHLKSEEPTDEDLAAPVKVVKGKSFNKLVLENGELWHDVMFEDLFLVYACFIKFF